MPQQELKLKIKGLSLQPNQLSSVPEGALAIANNIVIDRDSVAESRRGLKQYSSAAASHVMDAMFTYRDRLIVHYNSTFAYDSDGAGTFVDYVGTFANPASGYTIHSVEANRSIYFTTSTGVKKLDSLTGTISSSGMPTALDGTATVNAAATGWMTDSTNSAYRMVWCYEDANDYLVMGAPSQRVFITNSSGTTKNIDLTFTIPSSITTSHFYQIYRAPMTATTSDVPGDDMQLVVEGYPSSTDITNGYFTVTDATPDSLKGAFLYTSPTQEGIAQSNYQPPYCKDMTSFRNSVFFANTRQKQRLLLTMIGAGFSVNDTVTIAGTTYTAKAAESIVNEQFQIYSGGTPSENIEDTCFSLIRVINRCDANTSVYAYYLSGFEDLPGLIAIEERGVGGASFAATASTSGVGALFSPALPTSGTTVSSTNDEKKNRVHISKASQPEACPLLQYVDCGSADEEIQRILALKDSVFVFKNDGIFRITGDDVNSFRVALFDNTAKLLASESCALFDNSIYCFTDNGVAAVSDIGVEVLSRPIEYTLIELTDYANFSANTWGIGYHSDRKYILHTVTASTDTYPTQAFVYNSVTNAWTRWTTKFSCGIINPNDNKLYTASPVNKYVYQERKNFTKTDYADEEYGVTITSSSGTTVYLSSTASCVAGMSLVQGLNDSIISSVDSLTQITVQDTKTWTAGAAKVMNPIELYLQFSPIHGGNPGTLKHFTEATLFFSDAGFNTIRFGVYSNFSSSSTNTDLTSVVYRPWGRFTWGAITWGGIRGGFQPIRTLIPKEHGRCLWLNANLYLKQVYRNISFDGLSLIFNTTSTRVR